MRVNKGIRIRINPNESQQQKLREHFGANRWLWNHFLAKRIKEYQEMQKGSTYNKDAAELTKLRAVNPWLSQTSCNSQQRTLKHLDDAFRRFFKKKAGYPNFKKKSAEQAFTLAGGIRLEENKIYIPKFQEGLKFNRKLPEFAKINNVTLRHTASGKYYLTLSVEADIESLSITNKDVGIDLGLKDFAVMSNGRRIKRLPATNKLKRAQQHLSRKVKGSNRYNKQRQKVAEVHEKITNSRNNFLHKASAGVVNNFDLIVVEDLVIKNLIKNHNLARAISEASWGEFLNQLDYKSAWYGKKFIKVDRFYPSSKTCSDCGWTNQDLTLKNRQWVCGGCGIEHDRDLNASINILCEGRKLNSERLSLSNERGEYGRPRLACESRQYSAKRLAKKKQ